MQYGTAIILSSAGLLGAKIIEANFDYKLASIIFKHITLFIHILHNTRLALYTWLTVTSITIGAKKEL